MCYRLWMCKDVWSTSLCSCISALFVSYIMPNGKNIFWSGQDSNLQPRELPTMPFSVSTRLPRCPWRAWEIMNRSSNTLNFNEDRCKCQCSFEEVNVVEDTPRGCRHVTRTCQPCHFLSVILMMDMMGSIPVRKSATFDRTKKYELILQMESNYILADGQNRDQDRRGRNDHF